jgi:hypothetical protein
MNLDDNQKQQVAKWIGEGLKLAEIQKRLETDLGIRMTYLEVRLLMDDLKLMPKNQEMPESKKDLAGKPSPAPKPAATKAAKPPAAPAPATGKVSVTVDSLTRPGAVVSGIVTFSDGKKAVWYLDQMGRLGVAPTEQGYRPSAADVQAFQVELQNELQKQGF